MSQHRACVCISKLEPALSSCNIPQTCIYPCDFCCCHVQTLANASCVDNSDTLEDSRRGSGHHDREDENTLLIDVFEAFRSSIWVRDADHGRFDFGIDTSAIGVGNALEF
jgi:hypothetical protein